MNKERWQQIDSLVQEALEREPEERARFLDEACKGDDDLRQEVETLLASNDTESFLQSPALEQAAALIAHTESYSLLGQRLGPYRIISQLGAGGMGKVYLAHDSRLKRKVALKILPPYFTKDEQRLLRFQQEARTVSALNHPNIITIFDIGEVDSIHYIATEYIEGETLRQQMRRKMKIDEVLDVAVQVAGALEAAHEAGIVHRDIKPENIMVRKDGYVKVLDFGLAKPRRGVPGMRGTETTVMGVNTEPGVVMGTANYMSPEQARGREMDGRTDIFSLGAVIYEMVTGRAPFEGETTSDVIAAILEKQPPPLVRYEPETPDELQRIVMKALRKDSEERYQTVKEMMSDLRDLRAEIDARARHEPNTWHESRSGQGSKSDEQTAALTANVTTAQTEDVTVRTMLSLEVIFNEIKRHKQGLAIALVALIVVIASVIFGIYRISSHKEPQEKLAPPLQTMEITRLTVSGKTTDAAISPDGRYVAYVMLESDQQSLWIKHIPTSKSIQIIPPADTWYGDLTFSSDSNYIYYLKESPQIDASEIYAVPVLGGTQRKFVERTGNSFALSPDNNQLAFGRFSPDQDELFLIIANTDGTGERTITSRKGDQWLDFPAWSPDGKTIAVAAGDIGADKSATIVEVNLENGAERIISKQKWLGITQLCWVPDGTGLVMIGNDQEKSPSQIWHLSYPDGEARRITNDLNSYGDVSVTADSRTLCTVQSGGTSGIWVSDSGDPDRARQITRGAGGDGSLGICWTPDGRIVYTSGANPDIWIMEADGSNQKELTLDSGANVEPSVSPDSRYIVLTSNRGGSFNIWRMDIDGNNPKQLTNGSRERWPQCTPDGKWVIYESTPLSGPTSIWKVPIDGGIAVQLISGPSSQPALSPDGKLIAFYKAQEIAVVSPDGGEPKRVLNVPEFMFRAPTDLLRLSVRLPFFRWAADGSGLIYVKENGGRQAIWKVLLNGDSPKRLVEFYGGETIFDWSRDGKQLAYSRYNGTEDVVLITQK
jgi:serine/threonine protein kinase